MCVYFTCGYMFVIVGVFRGQRHCTPEVTGGCSA